jgi:Amt family ammonium transporter
VFLRACPLPLAEQIAGRIRDRIRAYRLTWHGQQFPVGASIGVVSAGSVEDGPTFLRLADAACYAAKNAGRDRVHVVGSGSLRIDTGTLRALRSGE